MYRIQLFLGGLLVCCLWSTAHAQNGPLTHQDRADVISGLIDLLETHYVIPATAHQLRDTLRANLARGAYDTITSGDAFAQAVTADLQALSGDLHLRLRHGEPEDSGGTRRVVRRRPGGDEDDNTSGSAGRRVVQPDSTETNSDPNVAIFERMQGIGQAEVLSGNVGYVPIQEFLPLAMEEEQAVVAMEAVAETEALIFDLRACRGGMPEMVRFIISYLYSREPFHLLTYYDAGNVPEDVYTLAEVPAPRRPDVPVYILTSASTASGGEEFSYTLKHHGRATLVGETTRGAGHGGEIHDLPGNFSAFIPDFRPVHPITGKGWEGVGVIPHITVPADEALTVAHLEALKRLRADGHADLDTEIARLEAETATHPMATDTTDLREYVGRYGIRTVTVENGALYLQRNDVQPGQTDLQGRRIEAPKLKLIPTDQDTFVLEEIASAKVAFGRDAEGRVVELHVLNRQGQWEATARDDR